MHNIVRDTAVNCLTSGRLHKIESGNFVHISPLTLFQWYTDIANSVSRVFCRRQIELQ